ncbi:MAG: L-threonylcarbamoyladenylate synthase [Candidatus Shapirobacteria bacterium]|nr:L-threonylcarbamoyladenylate synthase [Candidatus Shapirobacteria bacterium]
MEIVKLNQNNQVEIVDKAVKIIKRGGLIIYPTETCYGAGVDATNQKAVDRLWQYKQERGNKPVLVAIANQTMAQKYGQLTPLAKKVFNQYLPGPVSIIVVSRGLVDSRVESSSGTLGIRMPNHSLVLDLVKKLNRPLTSTSANVSNTPNPYSIINVLSQADTSLIDLIIDQGPISPNPPSTLVDTTGKELQVLRQGQVRIILATNRS